MLRLFFLGALSIAFMVFDHRQNQVSWLHDGFSALLHPIRLIANFPNSASSWFRESFASRRDLQQENASLLTQHLVLKTQLQKMESLEAENLRLRSLLGSSFNVSNQRMLIAELMTVDLDPFRHQITINKGANHDLYVGQPLVDSEGIMGQLVRVSPYSSTAMLITDPGHAIPVEINRNGLRTIALGTGASSELHLPYIANNADIKVGDLITTSGLGGRFPQGFPVGEIVRIDQNPGKNFAQVIVQPRALLDRSRVVLMLWPSPAPEEIDKTPDEDVQATEK